MYCVSGDIVNQAKDSNTKFIVSSQKCADKSVDVKDKLSQQIKVMIRLTLTGADFERLHVTMLT